MRLPVGFHREEAVSAGEDKAGQGLAGRAVQVASLLAYPNA